MTKSITKPLIYLNNYLLSCANQTKYLTCLFMLLFSSMGWGQTYLANQSFDATTFVPTNWTNLITSGSNTWTRVTSGTYPTCSPRSGAGMAKFNSYISPGTGVSSLITPVLDFSTAGTKRITFWMYRDNGFPTDADKIEIYTNTSANLTAATLLGTINRSRSLAPTVGSDGWYEYYYDVTTTSATTYVIFKAVGAYGNNMYIDDINVSAPPVPCSGTPSPGNTIASVNPVGGGSSTVLSLQNATTGLGVTYQWKSSIDNVTYTSISGATNATYTATPSAATYYVCDVTCSGVTTTSNPVQVTLIYCTPTSASSSTYHITGVTITGGVNNFANTATGSGLLNSYSNYSSTISCSQYATGNINYSISLAGNASSNSNSYGLALWVDWNNNLVFETSERMYNSAAYIYSASGSFTVPSGTPLGNYRMRIVTDYDATSPTACALSSGNGEIEDYTFTVVAQPTCMAPTALATSSITNNSASLSWTASVTAPSSGYEVYYSTTNTAPVTGTTASASVASGTTYAFTGLTPNTTYYSWVRSNCGSGDLSTWAASASFTTLCDPISSFPYSENFDGVTTPALPNCWSVLNVNNDTDKWITYTGYSQSGNNSVGLYTDYNAGANNDFLISPQFNLSGIKRLKYSVRARSSSEPNDYRVLLSTTGSSASDFSTVLLPLTSVSSTSYTEVIIDLSMYSGNIFIAFNVPSGGLDGYYIYIDDVIIEDTPNTWTGTTSNSWNTSGNWSLGTVPTSSDNIVISSNTPNAPVMDVDVTIPAGKSLRINSSGTLTIAPGKVLTIAGTANFNGKAVTFKSDATGTAMLGTLTGTLNGATNVKVERFIPSGKRAFRLLSPAVTTTTFISGNWQGQTHITGGASGGFDVSETNNPSMFTYNNQVASGTGWTPIANTNATNLTAGVGYRMLVRGDRTPTNITAATTDNMNAAITLSATGTLKTGTVTLDATSTPAINNTANTTTADYSLVGNPYQSAVDWNAVTKSGIAASYYAWDPNMGTSIQRGRYVVFNGTTNDNVSSQVGQFIQPGQAFFVKNTVSGTAGTLTFQEAHKASTNANVFRTNNQTESTNFATLSMQLYDPNELAIGGYPIDATKAVFGSEYTNELGLGDATKLEAAGENIAWFRNNTKLAIDAAAPVTTSDELIMKTLRLGANKNYTFKIQTTNFDTALTPYLVDNFLNTQTEISTSQAYLATFATTSNVASYNENRFKIVFQNALLNTDTFATQVGLYPNPSKGNGFYLQLPSTAQTTVRLYNTLGQEIAISHNEGHYQAKQSLAAGVYHIMVTQGEKTSKLKWIVE